MKNFIVALLTMAILAVGMALVSTAPANAATPNTANVNCGSTMDREQSITMTKYLRAEVTIWLQLCIEKRKGKDPVSWSRVTGAMYKFSYSRPGPSCGPPGGLNKVTFRSYFSDTSGRNFNQPAVSIKCSEKPVSTYRDYRKSGIFLRAFHWPKARVNIYADFAKPAKDVSDSMFFRLEPWKG